MEPESPSAVKTPAIKKKACHIEEYYFDNSVLEAKPGEYRQTTIAVGSFDPNALCGYVRFREAHNRAHLCSGEISQLTIQSSADDECRAEKLQRHQLFFQDNGGEKYRRKGFDIPAYSHGLRRKLPDG